MKHSVNVEIPIKVLVPMIPGKQNSIFYAGKAIAEVTLGNKTYVLTTSGEYKYALKCNSNTVHDETSPAVKTLTDAKIKKLDDDDLVSNWGWFGINIWETDKFVDSCNDVYSGYNEAMDAFKAFIQRTVIAS